jgi:uncharacterized membrane protein YjfL (UPF0719 family)
MDPFLHLPSPVVVALWAFYAVFLSVIAMKLYDWLTPGKFEDQVFKEKNVAAAVVYAGAFVGFAIVIASAMH